MNAQCEGYGPGLPNVWWTFKDSVAACPAGDSLIGSTRPSQLRVVVNYSDGTPCILPKIGIPPDSIWVTVTSLSPGNAKANDIGEKVFADDSTNISGQARIRIQSLSGCGKLKLDFYVSGDHKGSQVFTIRSTDSDADGRTTSADISGLCDLNYDSETGGTPDLALFQPHLTDWHRHVLYGTPVRRTNHCATCDPGGPGTHGAGAIDWSPDGKTLVVSEHVAQPTGDCALFLIPSAPEQGNQPVQFTQNADDYNPSWSPLGDEIAFERDEYQIWRKGVPGTGSNPDELLVTESGPGGGFPGDLYPAISPDGRTIAFSRFINGGFSIYTIPITGGSAFRVTSDSNTTDWFPSWSTDGQWIIFQRFSGLGAFAVYKVPVSGGSPQLLASPPASAYVPVFSPDSKMSMFAIISGNNFLTHTYEPVGPGGKLFPRYSEYIAPAVLASRWSPDGTRTALVARPPGTLENEQVWAVRRNMSKPPMIVAVGSYVLEDETVRLAIAAKKNKPLTLAITALDPESDPISHHAFFLRPELGMSFDSGSGVFSWTPPASVVGQTFHVRFQVETESGGTDFVVVQITVTNSGLGPESGSSPVVETSIDGTAILRVQFRDSPSANASLRVYDVRGRLIARVDQTRRGYIEWGGVANSGVRVQPGVYWYLLSEGGRRHTGRVVVVK